jgi:hypothetical protein
MPKFLPALPPEELAKRRAVKTSRVDLAPYLHYIQGIQPRHAGEVELQPGESKPTIKRRVTMAATRLGKEIRYLRSPENRLLFEVDPEKKG